MNQQELSRAKQKLENFPPFQNMGVKVLDFAPSWQSIRLLLPFILQNKNPGGTMFGGAIAALADPIAALACVYHFPDYAVWTKSLSINFVRPGNTDLELIFRFPSTAMSEIKEKLIQTGSADHTFEYDLYLNNGQLCSKVSCVVALRPRSDTGSCI